jgi:hypothetical protein
MTAGDAQLFIDEHGQEQPGPWKPGYSRVRLEEIKVNKVSNAFHSFCLLVSYANARAADPGRRDFKSDKINLLKLGDDGGLEFGAHLVIGDVSQDHHVNSSKCALEEMTGLGRARVIHFLQELAERHMEEAKRPTWTHKPKRGRTTDHVGRLRLTSSAERSETLKDMVENDGRVIGVNFIRSPHGRQLTDEFPAQLEPEEVVLRAKVRSTSGTVQSAARVLHAAAEFARKGGWKMRAEIEQGEGPEARRKIRPYDLEETDLDDQLYARRHPLKINTTLPQCYESINGEVNKALCQILDQKDLWT